MAGTGVSLTTCPARCCSPPPVRGLHAAACDTRYTTRDAQWTWGHPGACTLAASGVDADGSDGCVLAPAGETNTRRITDVRRETCRPAARGPRRRVHEN